MRYDTPVYFQLFKEREYNYETGDYEDDGVSEEMVYASVENSRYDTVHFVYGGLKEGSLTIHLQNHYTKPFARLRIGKKVYKADYIRRLRVKMAIVVSEVVTGEV